jgi:hypothetical protein
MFRNASDSIPCRVKSALILSGFSLQFHTERDLQPTLFLIQFSVFSNHGFEMATTFSYSFALTTTKSKGKLTSFAL